METVREPLIVLDGDLRVETANRSFYRIFQTSPEETEGRLIYELGNQQWEIPGLRKLLDEILPKSTSFKDFKVEHDFPAIGRRILLLNARRIAQSGNGKQMILLAMEDVTERKQMEKILRDSLEDSRLVSSRALEVHEIERKRVAHDIHDGIGQSLLAAKMKVQDALRQAFGSNSEPGSRISETIDAILQENIAEIQRLYMGLRPATLDDLGILPTITWSCREFKKTNPGIRLETEIEVEEEKVPPLLKTTIYRVMQEALGNVAEHSKADLVHLSLRNIGDKVQLLIKDNGQGFNVEEVLSVKGHKRGFGLASMRERTEISGGVFAVESVKGKGTTITASWKATTAPQ